MSRTIVIPLWKKSLFWTCPYIIGCISRRCGPISFILYAHLMSTKSAFSIGKLYGCGCPNFEVMSSPVFVPNFFGTPCITVSAPVFFQPLMAFRCICLYSNCSVYFSFTLTHSALWGSTEYFNVYIIFTDFCSACINTTFLYFS